MANYKTIRSGEAESTYEVKNKNSRIEKKHHDENLQVSLITMSTDRILYVEPLSTSDAYKSYYIVKGSCFVFDDGSILREGDMMIFRNTDEVHTLKTLEDTVILVHATHYDVYKTIEEQNAVIDKLLKEIQQKDHYTGEHSLRVFELVKKLGVRMGYKSKALNNLTKAAYYHDLGKIFVDDHILNKPGQLDEIEYEEIKKHVSNAKEMILEHFSVDIYNIIIQHHERVNGSGYPYGLKGDDICEEAMILAVCDCFDAMITNRVYKNGKSTEIALLELKELSGILYDPKVVSEFVEMILE